MEGALEWRMSQQPQLRLESMSCAPSEATPIVSITPSKGAQSCHLPESEGPFL